MKIHEVSNEVVECLERMSSNPWSGTIMEGYYALNNRAKGARGEEIVEVLLKQLGYSVNPAKHSSYDRIVNGINTEIKFSAATGRNNDFEFIFNHIGKGKEWEEVIFCGINGDLEIRMVRFNRDTFPYELFNTQQGGKNGNNDDLMCSGKQARALLFHENAEVLY